MTGAERRLFAFVGPSISRAEAAGLGPDLDLRPPARRDDLYREREAGAWGFLLVDGVFMQDDAVSPREVVDVLDDGAMVLGASSMGALRAADCWPAGARGIGLIYRLYRRGVLESDEDVAVAVSADGAHEALSVPLVNVRYAAARAVGRRLVDRPTARRIVEAAVAIYYPERTWREVWRRLDSPPAPEVRDFCAGLDLKRQDARRALAEAQRLACDAALAFIHGRRDGAPFARSEATRERAHDATGGVPPEALRGRLLDWLIGSGRLARYRPVSSWPTAGDSEDFARTVWHELVEANQLDAELMRLHAVERAAAEAAARPVRPEDLRDAQAEIVKRYGLSSWNRLLASPAGRPHAARIEAACERLARAKSVRRAWFAPRDGTPHVPAHLGLWQRLAALARRSGAR